MMLARALAAVSVAAFLGCSACHAQNADASDSTRTVGVVLLHGKGGDTRWIDPLASRLRSAGYRVETPDMAWHRNRIYDKTFDDALAEINTRVAAMKSQGVRSVVLAGHSLGAVAAAGYAARYEDIQGLILLAPGHFTGWPGFHRNFSDDLGRAQDMIQSGKGDEKSGFADVNDGKRATRHISARIFASWFSDTGPAEFVFNMKSIKGGIPVLYVAGSQDRIPQTANREYAFDKVPGHPKSEFVIVDSKHLEVPARSDEVVARWLKHL